MAASTSYLGLVKDVFAPFGKITVRRMFGGAGVYCDGLMFAIIGDDDLWLKVDDVTRATFEAAGLAAFTYDMKDGRSARMSYYGAPEEIFDDHGALEEWTRLALEAARRAAAAKSAKSAKSARARKRKG